MLKSVVQPDDPRQRSVRAGLADRAMHAALAGLFLAGGVGVILYSGPGRAFVRGSVGDVLVVPFLVHLLGIVIPSRHALRIAAVGVFAIGVELFQLAELVGPDAPAWLHLTLGSTFDLWDLVGYAVGMAVASGIGTLWTRLR